MIADSIPTTGWVFSSYESLARYGSNYYGLRGRLSILTEAFSHDPFARRIASTYAFVGEALSYIAERKREVLNIGIQADAKVASWARNPATSPRLSLQSRMDTTRMQDVRVEVIQPVADSGRREAGMGNRQRTGIVKLVRMPMMVSFTPTVTSTLPFAYAIEARAADAMKPILARHGIKVEQLSAAAPVTAQAFTIDSIWDAGGSESARRMRSATGSWAPAAQRSLPAGTLIVRAAQPYGLLAFYLLEPQSEDGLLRWGLFEGVVGSRQTHAVMRITRPATLRTTPAGN